MNDNKTNETFNPTTEHWFQLGRLDGRADLLTELVKWIEDTKSRGSQELEDLRTASQKVKSNA